MKLWPLCWLCATLLGAFLHAHTMADLAVLFRQKYEENQAMERYRQEIWPAIREANELKRQQWRTFQHSQGHFRYDPSRG